MPHTELLVEIARMQGEMNSKLDTLIATTSRHGKRITVLEKKWQRLFSWVTVVGTSITVALNYVLRRNA